MRIFQFAAPAALGTSLALGTVLLAGCDGGTDPGTDPETDAPTDPTDTDDRVDPTETAIRVAFYVGDATIDLIAATYSGVENFELRDAGSGDLLCGWSYTATDFASDPDATGTSTVDTAACMDAVGTPCEFAFDVNIKDSVSMPGPRCDLLAGTGSGEDAGHFGYGYMTDYDDGAGNVIPEALMFQFTDGWGAATDQVSWDDATGAFGYVWIAGYGGYYPDP